MLITRRRFLTRSAALAGGAVLGAGSLDGLLARAVGLSGFSRHQGRAGLGEGGYGPLVQAGTELALPPGFTYRLLGVEGDPMSDGRPTPIAHDAMAAFALPGGNARLIRNHESRTAPQWATPIHDPDAAYDVRGAGGTTSIDVEPFGARRVVRETVSCAGTIVNCAGGPTPWNSWLTCEETTCGVEHGYDRPHGYVFDVPASMDEAVEAVPLKDMGRFVHEAVAVDPATGIVYQTEDARRSGFYRFIPTERGNLAAGGRLQMLAIVDRANYDTGSGQTVGEPLAVSWVDIADPDPPTAGTDSGAVFKQGWAQGGARFAQLEGCWYGNGSIWINSTAGGDAGLGQVWRFTPRDDGDELSLFYESTGRDALANPDNITVSPRGGILLCEDTNGPQHLRGLTPDGRIFDFGRNLINEQEFAGACYNPDGETLFVNIQGDTRPGGPGHRSMTFAIWGPWADGVL